MKTPLSIKIDPKTKEALQKQADKEKRSMSATAEIAIEEYIKKADEALKREGF